MAVSSKYQLVKYDLSKGMRAEYGPAMNQGLIPRYLVDLSYINNSLVNRRAVTAYTGSSGAAAVYSADYDVYGATLSTDGTMRALGTGFSVTNIATDGRRVFGQASVAEGVSQMSNAGVGKSDYVVELKDGVTGKYWHKTWVPAPRAAVPLFSAGAPDMLSMNSGHNGEPLLLNGYYGTKVYVSDGGAVTSDPSIAILGGNTDSEHMVAAGGGFFVYVYDGIPSMSYCDGMTLRNWRLKDTGGSSDITLTTGEAFDAIVIGSYLYIVAQATGTGYNIYRYAVPQSAGIASASTDLSSPTSLVAATQNIVATANEPSIVAISSQTSPTELRVAMGRTTGGTGTVYYGLYSLTTLALSSIYSVAATRDYFYALTCNGNMILAETSNDATEFSSGAFGYTINVRNNSKVSAYVYDASAAALVEKDLFPESTERRFLTQPPFEEAHLYSHISSEGLVCVGNNIYRVLENRLSSKAEVDAGVQDVEAQFICKAIDTPSTGIAGGVIGATGNPARKFNSISRWVDERYVALPVGGLESAPAVTDTTPTPDVTSEGMTSNERVVVFDIAPTQLSAVEVADGITSFGHGWSISADGSASHSCAPDRPFVSTTAFTAARSGLEDWTTDEDVYYRVVAVCSVGGIESFVSSPTYGPVRVVAGDVGKDITVTVNFNSSGTTVKKLRLYRGSSEYAANDFYYITESSPPTAGTSTVTMTDYRIDPLSSVTTRPLDPTGGGLYTQGTYVSGQRDIASVAGRSYIATSTHVYPCQEPAGDDYLPTPMPDAGVAVASRYGRVKHVNELADGCVVSTEKAVVGIGGDPVNALGNGALQATYLISDRTGCNGKPVSTPAGLVVPRANGLMLVDRSRNVQEMSGAVSVFCSDGAEFTGGIAYCAETGELLVHTDNSVGHSWLVYDMEGSRWTCWSTSLDDAESAACADLGPHSGLICFSDWAGYIDTNGTDTGVTRVPPEITIGWDSFPDRFSVSNLRAVYIDGDSSDTEITATMESSFNLSRGTFTETDATCDSGNPSALYRDAGGARWSLYPSRIQGTSFKNTISFATTQTLYIDTIAVEVQQDTSKYSSSEA